MRRTVALATTALLSLALLAGCGDEEPAVPAGSGGASSAPPSTDASSSSAAPSSGAATPSPAAEPAGAVIAITVDGDDVTPNGERVEVEVDEPIQLDITADAPGEIHVHSTPEQEYEYAAGSTTIDLTPVERAGIVDVESHTLDKIIVQLQVQ